MLCTGLPRKRNDLCHKHWLSSHSFWSKSQLWTYPACLLSPSFCNESPWGRKESERHSYTERHRIQGRDAKRGKEIHINHHSELPHSPLFSSFSLYSLPLSLELENFYYRSLGHFTSVQAAWVAFLGNWTWLVIVICKSQTTKYDNVHSLSIFSFSLSLSLSFQLNIQWECSHSFFLFSF